MATIAARVICSGLCLYLLGNRVVMFPGSKVVGNVHVGNNVVIAANSVVFLLEETMLSFDNQFALNYIKKKILKCTTIFKL